MKNKKYLLKAVIAFLLTALLITIIFLGNSMFTSALKPVPPEKSPDSPHFIQSDYDYESHFKGISEQQFVYVRESYEWLKNNSRKVHTSSHDGLTLNAYMMNQQQDCHNYILLMHGWNGSCMGICPYARHFYEQGYNIVCAGQRGHGWSEGSYIDMGILARYDVAAWIIYITHKDPEAKIGLWGISMGAATVLMASGLDLPSNVIVAVEDCGYTSVNSVFNRQIWRRHHLAPFPVLNVASLFCKLKNGFFFGDGNVKKAVKNSDIPTLFIHGSEDDFIPCSMCDRLYKAANCQKEQLIVQGAGHGRSVYVNPDLYWSATDRWLRKYFFPSETAQEEEQTSFGTLD